MSQRVHYMSSRAFIPPMVRAWCMHGPFVEHARVPGHSHGLHNRPGGPQDDGTTPSSRHARLPPSSPPSRLSSCQPLPPRSPTHPHPRLYSGNQNAPHPPSASPRRTSQWPSGPPRPSSCVARAPARPRPHRAQTAKHTFRHVSPINLALVKSLTLNDLHTDILRKCDNVSHLVLEDGRGRDSWRGVMQHTWTGAKPREIQMLFTLPVKLCSTSGPYFANITHIQFIYAVSRGQGWLGLTPQAVQPAGVWQLRGSGERGVQ